MIKVSVCCITFGHEQYLAQAIESVMAQVFDGVVEMVIGEDCSPDGTRALALAYQARHPGRVRVLTPATNLGVMHNLMATLAACDGDYIAILDGDDYWTDPTKLQRQVDALRANPDCTFCFHDAEIVYQAPSVRPPVVFSQHVAAHALPAPAHEAVPLRFTQLDLARVGWIAPTAALLFRADTLPRPLPAWFGGVFSGDYTLQLLSTSHGPALYLPCVMSRYRLHAGGVMQISHNTLAQNGRRIFENEHYRRAFAPQLHVFFKQYLEYLYFERSEKLGQAGQRWQQLYFYFKAVSVDNQRLLHHVKRIMHRIGEKTGVA